MYLPKVGIWTAALEVQTAVAVRRHVAEIEELGYSTIWIPEAIGREAMTNAAMLLGATQQAVIATGIASIWARAPVSAVAAQRTLGEAYPDRFLLGLGVSHQPMVEGIHRRKYATPYRAMCNYLDAMDSASLMVPGDADQSARVLAALGPKMLRLAADHARGAHPYFVPVAHTAEAREVMGPGPWLLPEQAVVLETDPDRAREIARNHMSMYLGLPNYTNNLKRFGFDESDFAEGGSNRLVDALVAWGGVEAIVERVHAHLAAGADHVAVQVLKPSFFDLPMDEWRALAPALTSI